MRSHVDRGPSDRGSRRRDPSRATGDRSSARTHRLRSAATVAALPLALALAVSSGGGAPTGARDTPAAGPSERLDAARDERIAAQGRLDAAVAELEDLTARVEESRLARQQLVADVAARELAAAEAEAALAEYAREAYRSGSIDPVLRLLEADTPQAALERARLLSVLGRADRLVIEDAIAARGALEGTQAALAETEAALAADRDRQAALSAELEAEFDEALEEETQVAELAARQRLLSRPGQSGVYACVIAAPFAFRDTWGFPRSGGRRHQGVDVFGPMGHPVYAITAGTVVRHSVSGLGGLGLYLRGDDGHHYYYAHLQSIRSGYDPGRRVEAGEHIAANGDTGNARGGPPHVHFEVRPGGGATVNPFPWVDAACN